MLNKIKKDFYIYINFLSSLYLTLPSSLSLSHFTPYPSLSLSPFQLHL